MFGVFGGNSVMGVKISVQIVASVTEANSFEPLNHGWQGFD